MLEKRGSNDTKERITYNVMFVPDKVSRGIMNFSIKLDKLIAVCLAIIVVVIVAIVYSIIITGKYKGANKYVEELTYAIELMDSEISSLENDNELLQEKVTILSSTINEKLQQQEQMESEMADAYVPSIFPLKGTATYNEEDTELDGNPIAIFHASEGTSVISAGSGTVESIDKDSNVYVVTIDHGNGYKSIYRNAEKPKVSEGDSVTVETEIFRISSSSNELGYQIIYEDEYIDPLGLMEIYG